MTVLSVNLKSWQTHEPLCARLVHQCMCSACWFSCVRTRRISHGFIPPAQFLGKKIGKVAMILRKTLGIVTPTASLSGINGCGRRVSKGQKQTLFKMDGLLHGANQLRVTLLPVPTVLDTSRGKRYSQSGRRAWSTP